MFLNGFKRKSNVVKSNPTIDQMPLDAHPLHLNSNVEIDTMDMTRDPIEIARDVPPLEGHVSPEEWTQRVELAAVYRLVCRNGWNLGIYNHASARVPGEPDYFLMKGHALLWDEVTASNLVKVNMHEELDESSGVNRPGFVLHSAILRARSDVNVVIHIHPDACVAVSTMKEGLLPLTQEAVFLHNRVGYHDYSGITESAEERAGIIAALGQKPALLMRNHGATTVGDSAREAYRVMAHLINACRLQLDLMATGAELVVPDEAMCAHVADQYEAHNRGRGQADWPGTLRDLEKTDPDYRV